MIIDETVDKRKMAWTDVKTRINPIDESKTPVSKYKKPQYFMPFISISLVFSIIVIIICQHESEDDGNSKKFFLTQVHIFFIM